MRMNVALEILTKEPAELAQRSALIPGAKRDLAMMSAKIRKLMDGYVRTIPPEQLRTYANSLKMVSYVIGAKRPGGQGRDDKNFGMWLPYEVINELLDGCHDHCMMCGLNKADRRRCPLRKALDTIPNDVEQSEDGDCPYYGIL